MESIKKMGRRLMMFSLAFAIGTGLAINAHAQTFAEWFSQKKTQKKYLLQQIAALQVYSGYLKQGYNIATNGLGSISGYLKSENLLHTTFFDRLKKADPAVRNSPMVKEILAWQKDILTITGEFNKVTGMSASENDYLLNAKASLLKDCDDQMNTLLNVISYNKIEMSDAERLNLLKKVHAEMMGNYQFSSRFAAQVRLMALSRQQEQVQPRVLKQIYEINQ